MKKKLARMIITIIGMFSCAGLAAILSELWPGAGGRNVGPPGIIMAFLILILASIFRGWARWTGADFMLGLIAVEITTLWVIGFFSGFTGSELLERFNLIWLAGINVLIIPPWIFGFLIGGILSARDQAI